MSTSDREPRPFPEVSRLIGEQGAARYLAAYPDPVLILEPFRAPGTALDQIDASTFGQTTTDVIITPELFSNPAVSAAMVHPEAMVAWVSKTGRNPFPGMVTVGRAGNNDVILPHGSISKIHAIFHRHGVSWLIEDRGSTNGTYLDGVRLPAQERRVLNDGSRLRFGEGSTARFFEAESFADFCELIAD